MISSTKIMGMKVLHEVINPDKFTMEDDFYMKECIGAMSAKTIWKSFYSASNFNLFLPISKSDGRVIYWYGEEEKKDCKLFIAYMKKASSLG